MTDASTPGRTVIQIVPRLPPPAEGVGSFALALAEALHGGHGIASRYLVASPAPFAAVSAVSTVSTVSDTAADPQALCAALAAVGADLPVLLHYAGYGYHSRGCPGWLVDGLREHKRRTGIRLVTFFHEVYASGPPWRSSFWLSRRQRRLAAQVARLSDGIVTSLEVYRRLLRCLAPEKEAELLPVFSAVGEPPEVPPLAGRRRRLVVFGGPGARARAYGPLAQHLAAACRALDIEEICDVGSGKVPELPRLAGAPPVRRCGEIPAAEVSALLLGSLAGFTTYPPPFLGKSTAFAAYCAHGVLPVCATVESTSVSPCWSAGAASTAPALLQATADAARAWYAGHSRDRHAAVFHRLLLPCAS